MVKDIINVLAYLNSESVVLKKCWSKSSVKGTRNGSEYQRKMTVLTSVDSLKKVRFSHFE